MSKGKIFIPKNCKFAGVYSLVNLNNGKCYVGSSQNISSRFSQHKSQLMNGKSHVLEMQEDFDSGNNFLFYVVLRFINIYAEEWKNKLDLVALENQTMDWLNSIENGYNKKQDLSSKTNYQSDIFNTKVNIGRIYEWKEDKDEYPPFIKLSSGYIQEFNWEEL